MRRFPTVSFVFFLLLFSFVLHAQSTSALLTGRVTDPSKALIIGARVTAISAGTGLRYEAQSNGAGEYHLANLSPGRYRIQVEKPGFNKLVKPDVVLHVQDALQIIFELQVVSSAKSVTVEGGPLLVNTGSATLSNVVDRTVVEKLPL